MSDLTSHPFINFFDTCNLIHNIKDIDKLDVLEDYVLDTINENINIAAYDGLDKDDIFEASRNLYRRRS